MEKVEIAVNAAIDAANTYNSDVANLKANLLHIQKDLKYIAEDVVAIKWMAGFSLVGVTILFTKAFLH